MRGEVLLRDVKADQPIQVGAIDSPYATNAGLRQVIEERGI